MKNIISFSGGRSSAYMTTKLLERGNDYEIVFANTGKEKEQTLEFVYNCEMYWQKKITWIEIGEYSKGFDIVDYKSANRDGSKFAALIEKRKFLPNPLTRFCTGDLKIKPIKRYLKSIGYTYWNYYFGIRYDEPLRWGKLLQNQQKDPWYVVLPMVDWKTTKKDVENFWKKMPFDLNINSIEGNCDLCFLKGKNKLLSIINKNPNAADWWIDQEKKIGSTFKKYGASYAELKYAAINQSSFFDGDNYDYPCHCNID